MDSPKNIKGKQVYVLECWSESERFLKIGYTSLSVSRRFSGKMPYQYKVLVIDLDENPNLESLYKDRFKEMRYSPKINFPGYLECYNYSCINDVLNFAKRRNAKYNVSHPIKSIEEKEIDNTTFTKKSLNDLVWLESVAIKNKITVDNVKKGLNEFDNHLITQKKQHNNYKEFCSHFSNWVSIRKSQSQRPKTTSGVKL